MPSIAEPRGRAKPFLFGTNFKMHQTAAESRQFVDDLQAALPPSPNVQRFLIPPFTSLAGLAERAAAGDIWIGAQNLHPGVEGAYTGEISAPMLAALGVKLALVGHAERRRIFGESDAFIGSKVTSALAGGLHVLLCVGETADDKRFGIESEVLRRQLKIALHDVSPDAASRLWVAYEPVWSIGESGTAAPIDHVARAVASIRAALAERFGRDATVPLLYGGSVTRDNCGAYAGLAGIDGLFVGRAAWRVQSFVEVLQASLAARAHRRD